MGYGRRIARFWIAIAMIFVFCGCERPPNTSASHPAAANPSTQRASIFEALDRDDRKLAKQLIQSGAPVDERNAEDDVTALMLAASLGDVDVLQLLVERGANVNLVNSSNETALFNACVMRQLAAVRFLLTHGADANVINRDGETALCVAVDLGQLEIVKELVAAKREMDGVGSSRPGIVYDPVA